MEKKIYVTPLVELSQVRLATELLVISGSSSGTPDPAPRPRTGTETF